MRGYHLLRVWGWISKVGLKSVRRIMKILNNNHGEAAWEAENMPSRKLVGELEREQLN